MFLSIIRAIKFSIQDMFRNIWLSIVTIIILILALFTVNMLLVVKVLGETAVDAVKEKIDINIFLTADSVEDEILALKTKIENFDEVKSIKYISKAQALEEFKETHQDNPQIIDSLKELGKNPLAPRLIIKPVDIVSFDTLVSQLNALNSEIIESRNFANYKTMIDKITAITNKVSEAGIILSSIFVFITVLVIYNSVRVAIYTHRREITVMRLVGASNWFIIMPYLISSIFYTLIGILIIMAMFFPFLSLLQPYLETFFVGYNVNLLDYYKTNSIQIFGIQFAAAVGINLIASYFAVRKYSDV